MNCLYDRTASRKGLSLDLSTPRPEAVPESEPFFYLVAGNLHRFMKLSREKHLSIWRQVLDTHAAANRPLPEFLQCLCEPSFVEDLMENEVFWAMVGARVNRACYANATEYLPALYCTAAVLAASQGMLPLDAECRALLAASE